MPIEAYKHLCALAVAILIPALLYLLWKWPQGRHMTFSQHAAEHRAAIFYYIGMFTIVLPLLSLFFVGWFAPAFELSGLFVVFILTAIGFQYSAALIPEVAGWKAVYHVAASTVSGVAMLLATTVLLFAPAIGGYKFLVVAGAVAMAGLLFVGAKNKITHPNLLVLQASYYAIFFAVVLVLTYFA